MKAIGLLLVCAAMTACAFTPQQARIDPTVHVAKTNEGQGVQVAFGVVDERDSKTIGNRGGAFGKGAQITTSDDVVAIVQTKVREGLENKGFVVTDYDDAAPVRLKVEVRALNYSTSVGFWTGGVEVKSALKAIGTRGSKPYEKIYRSDDEKRVVAVPTAGKNEEWINTALTDVLTQLFDDIGLIRHLAGTAAQ